MMSESPLIQRHRLSTGHCFHIGKLPNDLLPSPALFDAIWRLHPPEYHEIMLHGRLIKTPRWQQAYGRDYQYTGRVNCAAPLPTIIQPFLAWTQEFIEPRLNGALLNWYDGRLGHYIGKHRDSTVGLVKGTTHVTISLGERRVFRLRRYEGAKEKVDFTANHGTVFAMPHDTNEAWTHEVPRSKRLLGQRISVTVRAFEPERGELP